MTTIQAKKGRFPVACIIGISLFAFLLFLIAGLIRNFSDNLYNNVLYLGLFAGLSYWVLMFSLVALLDFARPRLSKNATLTITDRGITDNLSVFSSGDILWTEITEIKIVAEPRTNFLVIGVTDPQKFITGKPGPLRLPLRSFLNKFGSPVFISQKRVDYDLYDLKKLLLEMQEQIGQHIK